MSCNYIKYYIQINGWIKIPGKKLKKIKIKEQILNLDDNKRNKNIIKSILYN